MFTIGFGITKPTNLVKIFFYYSFYSAWPRIAGDKDSPRVDWVPQGQHDKHRHHHRHHQPHYQACYPESQDTTLQTIHNLRINV